MHVVSFTGDALREQYLQPCGMEGRREERVHVRARVCVEMEGEQRKAIPFKTTNSLAVT